MDHYLDTCIFLAALKVNTGVELHIEDSKTELAKRLVKLVAVDGGVAKEKAVCGVNFDLNGRQCVTLSNEDTAGVASTVRQAQRPTWRLPTRMALQPFIVVYLLDVVDEMVKAGDPVLMLTALKVNTFGRGVFLTCKICECGHPPQSIFQEVLALDASDSESDAIKRCVL
jgi:pyruvate carboxylase